MQTITWSHQCYYCHRPITRGRPTLLFSVDQPKLIGVSHSTCCSTRLQYGHYQLCPPDYLSSDIFSFWMHFYPMLHKLPGGFEPNCALRSSLVHLLFMPGGLDDPMINFREYQKWNKGEDEEYKGNLERDFLKFLGQVQMLTKEQPVEIEVDFRK